MKLIFDIIKTGREFPSKRNFHFEGKNGIIGRADDCDWQLLDSKSYISNSHIQIEYKDNIYFIKDISTNGTFLKHPYKKLPKNIAIKINSTDIFIVGEYEIQARFIDNDYSKNDIIGHKSFNDISNTNQLIPDDSFFLENNSIMNNSFVAEDEEDYENNFMTMFQDEENEHFDDLYDFEKEPFEVQNDYKIDSVTNELKHEHINIPTFSENKILPDEINSQTKINEDIDFIQKNDSLEILEKKLGISLSNLSKKEKDEILEEIATIVINSLDGLQKSLEIKDKVKKDILLDKDNIKDNNPVRMGQYAINLLNERTDKESIKLSEAIKKSFNELNIHNIALHGSSKNLINIALLKFSPKSLEHHFESIGEINNLMPKKYQMWDSYINMFQELNENPDFGVNLIAKDFTNEYNNIAYTIKLTSI